MKPGAARALPPQDDQLMSQRDKVEFQRRSAAKPEREHGNESRQNGDHAARPYGDHAGKSASFPDSSEFWVGTGQKQVVMGNTDLARDQIGVHASIKSPVYLAS
jgi:hypothetical protein